MTLDQMFKQLIKNTQQRSILKGRDFDITIHDLNTLWEQQSGLCALTGFNMDTQTGSQYKVSIDRIHSNKGYTADNIQLVCRLTNRAKSDMINEDFIRMCTAVANQAKKTLN